MSRLAPTPGGLPPATQAKAHESLESHDSHDSHESHERYLAFSSLQALPEGAVEGVSAIQTERGTDWRQAEAEGRQHEDPHEHQHEHHHHDQHKRLPFSSLQALPEGAVEGVSAIQTERGTERRADWRQAEAEGRRTRTRTSTSTSTTTTTNTSAYHSQAFWRHLGKSGSVRTIVEQMRSRPFLEVCNRFYERRAAVLSLQTPLHILHLFLEAFR
ncbi:hypothetical protein RI054_44g152840 [Pseudoscourfieldia marina]